MVATQFFTVLCLMTASSAWALTAHPLEIRHAHSSHAAALVRRGGGSENIPPAAVVARAPAAWSTKNTRRKRGSTTGRCKNGSPPSPSQAAPPPPVNVAPAPSSSPAKSPTPSPAPPPPAAPAPAPAKSSPPAQAPPPPPPAPAPAPASPSSGGNSLLSQTFSGDATFYAPGLGACGITNGPNDLIAAAAFSLFDSFPGASGNPNANPICGKSVTASVNGKSVTVQITDRCAGCDIEGSLDFSPAAFDQLADPAVGRVHGMTWHFNN